MMMRDERLELLNCHRVASGLDPILEWSGSDDALRRELDAVENRGITLRYEDGHIEVVSAGHTTRYSTDSEGQQRALRHVSLGLGATGRDPLIRQVLSEAMREGAVIADQD